MNQLTPERARQLAKGNGFVKSPGVDRAQHMNSAKVVRVIGNNVEIKPPGHRRTDIVPISSLTEHKSRTAGVNDMIGRFNGHAQPDKPEFVVVDISKRLFWGGSTGPNRGWTKDIEKARMFENIAGAGKARGHLRNVSEWRHDINPEHLRAMHKVDAALVPKPVKVEPELNGHAPEPAAEAFVTGMTVEPASNGQPYEVPDQNFHELRTAYREYELAVSMVQDAQAKIRTALGRISNGMRIGDAVAGVTQ